MTVQEKSTRYIRAYEPETKLYGCHELQDTPLQLLAYEKTTSTKLAWVAT
jgi:hypothetical protein